MPITLAYLFCTQPSIWKKFLKQILQAALNLIEKFITFVSSSDTAWVTASLEIKNKSRYISKINKKVKMVWQKVNFSVDYL